MAQLTNSSNVTSDNYHLGAVDAGDKLGNHVILIDASGNVITTLPVTVNGRKAGVTVGSFDQTLNVAASGSAIITITPTADELWRIKMLSAASP